MDQIMTTLPEDFFMNKILPKPMYEFKEEELKNRIVGRESNKTYLQNLKSGFFQTFMKGQGIDVGGQGYAKDPLDPILPNALIVDTGFPNYNGTILPFKNESLDYVYSSHCLEHIANYVHVIQDWYRVTKTGGYIITIVPHQYVYEKKSRIPSIFNPDHKRFYTPSSLLKEFEDSLIPNIYRVRILRDEVSQENNILPPHQHTLGTHEILLVIQKVQRPDWLFL